jgi:hypothetical protein
MTTEQVDRPQIEHRPRSPWPVVGIIAGLAVLGLIVHNARYGAVSPRIRNPHGTGGPHPLTDPLFALITGSSWSRFSAIWRWSVFSRWSLSFGVAIPSTRTC